MICIFFRLFVILHLVNLCIVCIFIGFQFFSNAFVNFVILQLTPAGRQMAAFPLDPRMSKVILSAKDYKCL